MNTIKNIKIEVTVRITKTEGYETKYVCGSENKREGSFTYQEMRTQTHGLLNAARNHIIEDLNKLEGEQTEEASK